MSLPLSCLGFIPLLIIGLAAFLVEPAEEDVVFLAIRVVSCVCLFCISSVFALLVFLFLVYLFSIYLFFVSSVSLPGDDVFYCLLSLFFFLQKCSRFDLTWFRLSCVQLEPLDHACGDPVGYRTLCVPCASERLLAG